MLAIQDLAVALQHNSTLSVSQNHISGTSLLPELRHNSTLQELWLNGNQIPESDKHALKVDL